MKLGLLASQIISSSTLPTAHWRIFADVKLGKHPGRGGSSLPTGISSGWPRAAQGGGRNSKFRFREVLSHDPQNIRAKCYRHQPSGVGALAF